MFVLCVLYVKTNVKMQDNQDKDTSTVEVQTQYKRMRKTIPRGRGGGYFLHPSTLALGSTQPPIQPPPHHLTPKLNNKHSYTSTPPLGLRSPLQGNLYPYLTLFVTNAFRSQFNCTSKHRAIYKPLTNGAQTSHCYKNYCL